ncbi:MAG: DUF3592 domain-containing protein [Burkholderia gladioli]
MSDPADDRAAWNVTTLIVMLIGAVVLVVCAVQAWNTATFLSTATRADGVVISASGHPTIRFTSAGGERVEFVQNGGLSRDVGAHVPVVYDPAAPARTACADTFFALWSGALWGLPAGFGFLVLPLFGVRFERSGAYGASLKR